MKNLIYLTLFLLVGCKTTVTTTSQNMLQNTVTVTPVNCPENGACTLELIPNKTIEFKHDKFGNTYPVISEGTKTILKFTYTKNTPKGLQDSSYTEIIYAELENNLPELSLHNENLNNVKLHFGRLCYCKGETGYYQIKSGEFNFKKSNSNSIQLSLSFKVSMVPQIISKINEIIPIK